MNSAGLASLLQRFFTQRLLEQQGVSSDTLASYRDTFRLLLRFATQHLGRAPCKLPLDELDGIFIEKFLRHLELDRGNSVRTRNTRLAAIHAFFRFVAISEPALGLQCQRILAIPTKRCEHGPVEFLTEDEVAALVAAPDPGTWIGDRDRTLLLVATRTGLRNHELTSLKRQDVALGTGAHVRCFGKGRKMRCTPLRLDVVAILKQWLSRQPGEPGAPVFPSSRGGHLSADALQLLVARHTATACGLSLAQGEKRHAAYAEARGRHGFAATWRGPDRNRALARSRIVRNNPNLLACRHATKGTRTRTCQ